LELAARGAKEPAPLIPHSGAPLKGALFIAMGYYYATDPIASPANKLRLIKIIQNTIF
jgi:hypothetical protein